VLPTAETKYANDLEQWTLQGICFVDFRRFRGNERDSHYVVIDEYEYDDDDDDDDDHHHHHHTHHHHHCRRRYALSPFSITGKRLGKNIAQK
jgi:hypothetical protein